jgi:hypothetical protein
VRSSEVKEARSVGYFTGTSRDLPDQPTPAVEPEVQRLAHVLVDGLIARLAAEPATPAASLLENLGDQLHQAASLRRLGVVQSTSGEAILPVAVHARGASARSQIMRLRRDG